MGKWGLIAGIAAVVGMAADYMSSREEEKQTEQYKNTVENRLSSLERRQCDVENKVKEHDERIANIETKMSQFRY